jgi:hypothetical protein
VLVRLKSGLCELARLSARSYARPALVDVERTASIKAITDGKTLGAGGLQRKFQSFRFRKKVRKDDVTLADRKSSTTPGTPELLWFWLSGFVDDRSFHHVALPDPVYIERDHMDDGADLHLDDGSAEDSSNLRPVQKVDQLRISRSTLGRNRSWRCPWRTEGEYTKSKRSKPLSHRLRTML